MVPISPRPAVLLALAVAQASATASAESRACGAASTPWVQVSIEGQWPEGFVERLLADFRAGLLQEGIDACTTGSGPAPALASVRIAPSDAHSVAVSVDLKDALTAKRVGRDVDLSRLPPDGRPLAVAVAADELLRASWAELALKSAPEPIVAPPPEVTAAVDRVLPKSEGRGSFSLGLRAAGERYLGGQTHVGGDVTLRQRFGRRWQAQAYGGLRQALDVRGDEGDVSGTATTFGATALLAVLPASAVELCVLAGAHGAIVTLEGEPRGDATGSSLSGVVVYAVAGVGLSARLYRGLRAELGVGAGLPLRSLEATEGGRVVTGVSGGQGNANLGITGEF